MDSFSSTFVGLVLGSTGASGTGLDGIVFVGTVYLYFLQMMLGTTDPFHPHPYRCYPTGTLRVLRLLDSPGGAGSGFISPYVYGWFSRHFELLRTFFGRRLIP